MALAVRLPPPPLLGRLLGKWVSPEALTLTPTLTFLALSAFYIELRECPYSLRLTQPLTSLFGRRRDATYGLGKHEWGEPIISALLASSCTLLMATGEGGKEPLARGIRRRSPSFFCCWWPYFASILQSPDTAHMFGPSLQMYRRLPCANFAAAVACNALTTQPSEAHP